MVPTLASFYLVQPFSFIVLLSSWFFFISSWFSRIFPSFSYLSSYSHSWFFCIHSWFSSALLMVPAGSPHTSNLFYCPCSLDILSSIPRHPVLPNWISCAPNLDILSIQPGYSVLPTWISYSSNLDILYFQPQYPILSTWISYSPNPDILFFPLAWKSSLFPVFLCPSFPSFCPLNWVFHLSSLLVLSPRTLVSPARWTQFYIAKWKKGGGGYEYENSIVPILLKVRSPIQIYVGRHILWLNCVCLISYYIIGPNLKEE